MSKGKRKFSLIACAKKHGAKRVTGSRFGPTDLRLLPRGWTITRIGDVQRQGRHGISSLWHVRRDKLMPISFWETPRGALEITAYRTRSTLKLNRAEALILQEALRSLRRIETGSSQRLSGASSASCASCRKSQPRSKPAGRSMRSGT